MNKTEDLAYWINERWKMRCRKEQGYPKLKYGWSDDISMGWVRYCNAHREDDKVTRWLAKNWRPEHHSVWEIVLARMINYIPSLEGLIPSLHAPNQTLAISNQLKARRDRGEKVFTSAYTISTCGKVMDKIDYVVQVVQEVRQKFGDGDEWCMRNDPKCSLAQAHEMLMSIDGLGSFLAAQVIADLKNTAGHPLQDAPDWHTWAAPGPGSLKGLSEYFGASISAGKFDYHIKKCWEEVKPLIDPSVPPIHMQDFQNCLCEFSKFERVKKGGHVRNKYRPWED